MPNATTARNQVEVELRPMSIVDKTPVGDFDTPIGQSQIFCNGELVGYIGDKPESPLNLIVRLPSHVRDQISEEVSRLRGSLVVQGSAPPDPQTVNEIIQARDRQQRQYFDVVDDDDADEKANEE